MQASSANGAKVALYARVSTGDQTVENQERELRDVCVRRGWQIVGIFEDQGVSGASGRDERPGFDSLWKAVTRRQFDMVCAWSVDRLGRSMKDVVLFVEELRACGVGLYLHQQAVDTSTPSGLALLQMAAVFAQWERSIIRERSMAGQVRARAQGVHCGRPRLPNEIEARVREALGLGMAQLKVAALVGVAAGTVNKIAKEMRVPRRP
jgi:DNA invertase Pin-like site-specific DNA recombinase